MKARSRFKRQDKTLAHADCKAAFDSQRHCAFHTPCAANDKHITHLALMCRIGSLSKAIALKIRCLVDQTVRFDA
ncbi:MAG: hypothetical protein EBW74_11415 [Betaproteobacteria bacterium]|nr:hypothetical protein [Betaproteobacteria bacterium]